MTPRRKLVSPDCRPCRLMHHEGCHALTRDEPCDCPCRLADQHYEEQAKAGGAA